VLGVLRALGYAKPRPGLKKQQQPTKWQARCASLLTERDQLQLELAELREENRMLKRSLGHVLAERDPLVIDEEALLKDFDKQPSLATLIAELKGEMEKIEE
jgi:FtsZ-binding cell division protein ZapB